MTDRQLIQQFAQTGSQAALGELVNRHIDFVYASALRQTCDPHLAEDVTQNVFITLAKKARGLSPRIVLEGWLFNTVRYTALNAMRQENRIKRREQVAARGESVDDMSDGDLAAITPHLDRAMSQLNEPDRLALLLRYFKGMSLRDVGAAVGISENGARMRVNRGLEKLRGHLIDEGVTAPVVLPVILEKIARQNAPAHLSTSIMGLSLLPSATSAGGIALAASFVILVVGIGALTVVAQLAAGPQTPAPAVVVAQAQPLPATAPASTQPQTPTAAIKALVDAFFAADKTTVQKGMLRDDPVVNAAVDAGVEYIRARGDLINAIEARFGPLAPQQKNIFERGITGNAMVVNTALMFAPMEVNGDQAVIHLPKTMSPHDMYLKQVGDTWKLDTVQTMQPIFGKDLHAFDSQTEQFTALAKSCDDITAAMQADVYPTQADVLKAFTKAADEAFTAPQARVLQAFLIAQFNGDKKTMQSLMVRDDPRTNDFADSVVDFAIARAALIKTLDTKFGPLTTEQKVIFYRVLPRGSTQPDPAVAAAQIQVDADAASLRVRWQSDRPFYMKKIGDAWKYDAGKTYAQVKRLPVATAQFRSLAKACDEINAAVQANQYATAAEALDAFKKADTAAKPPVTQPAK